MDMRTFADLLCEENRYSASFVCERYGRVLVEEKGSNLVEVARRFLDQEMFPLVDRGLNKVFGIERCLHASFCADLYRYHCAAAGVIPTHVGDTYRLEYLWVVEGRGYYVSAMYAPRRVIIIGKGYQPDPFDEELLKMYKQIYTL